MDITNGFDVLVNKTPEKTLAIINKLLGEQKLTLIAKNDVDLKAQSWRDKLGSAIFKIYKKFDDDNNRVYGHDAELRDEKLRFLKLLRGAVIFNTEKVFDSKPLIKSLGYTLTPYLLEQDHKVSRELIKIFSDNMTKKSPERIAYYIGSSHDILFFKEEDTRELRLQTQNISAQKSESFVSINLKISTTALLKAIESGEPFSITIKDFEAKKPATSAEQQLKFLTSKFEDVDLSVRCYNALKGGSRVQYVWQIPELLKSNFKFRNFGKRSKEELQHAFTVYGLDVENIPDDLMKKAQEVKPV